MQNETNTDNLILQLRNLINNNSKTVLKQTYSNFIKKAPRQSDFQKMLMQSSRLISQDKQSPKKIQTRNKILAASELLKDQKSDLIKNYIKQKISSQIFGNKTNLTLEQTTMFEQQKQVVILQRQKQIEQQKIRRKKIIQNIRQYDNNPAANVPVLQIDRILQKEEPDSGYLLKFMNNQSKKLSSKNNNIKNTNLSIQQIYSIHQYERKESPKKVSPQRNFQVDEQYQEVAGQLQQQNVESSYYTNSQQGRVFGLLNKKKNFVKIFYKYLQNQSKINSLNNVYDALPGFLKGQEQKSNKQKMMNQKYVWTNKPKIFKKKQAKKQLISDITKIYRAKGVMIILNASIKMQKHIICEKRINKMIGQGDKFHPKKCILTTQELYYFQEKANQSDYKNIQLTLQKIQVVPGKKDEGSFFSKKQEDIEIAIVNGKNRIFKFQKNYLEGQDLYYQISKLMALKLHFLNSKIHGRSNNSVINFIFNQKTQILNLGNQYVQLIQNYPAEEHREMTLQILLELFPIRKQIKQLSLQNSRLTPIQLNSLLNKCQLFKNLSVINLQNNRLLKQNVQNLFQLINRSETVKNFKLNLVNTKIDDQILNGNSGIISLACQKINYLNLSKNNITTKSITTIKNCLQIGTCQIKHLQMNQCPLSQIKNISGLIKQAKHLQILSMKQCGLELDLKDQTQLQLFFSSFKRTVIKQIHLNGNGLIKNLQFLEDNWGWQYLQRVYLDVNLNQLCNFQIKLLKGQIFTKGYQSASSL